ncbi:MAG: helix-turn-helix domain-containing protein [Brevinematia bacterium]
MNKEKNISFSERFEKSMNVLNLTIEKVSEDLNVNRNTVLNYKKGVTEPKISFLIQFCEQYKVNLNWLLTGEGEMFTKPFVLGQTKLGEGYLSGGEEKKKELPPMTIEEAELLEKIKNDKELLYICQQLKDINITKSVIYSLLKAKEMDEASLDKYLKILKTTLE